MRLSTSRHRVERKYRAIFSSIGENRYLFYSFGLIPQKKIEIGIRCNSRLKLGHRFCLIIAQHLLRKGLREDSMTSMVVYIENERHHSHSDELMRELQPHTGATSAPHSCSKPAQSLCNRNPYPPIPNSAILLWSVFRWIPNTRAALLTL